VSALTAEPVRVGQFNNMIFNFVRIDHSKTRADKLFALIATKLSKCDYFNHLYVLFLS
jgi:hypothetical protein